ncbi:hypothetical protein PIB30_057844 [Stylosanthes scabra]|uniref:Uncharacterized protein n=1 Tax=Stylosanthes scabra TaxID=79078 RepID=A0ABU6VK20_9FABA|nr:hypothetical protein [Stylosanthes scabra]
MKLWVIMKSGQNLPDVNEFGPDRVLFTPNWAYLRFYSKEKLERGSQEDEVRFSMARVATSKIVDGERCCSKTKAFLAHHSYQTRVAAKSRLGVVVAPCRSNASSESHHRRGSPTV